jgi:hypothetical protein
VIFSFFFLSWLFSLIMLVSCSIHFPENDIFHFYLQLSNIPLYIYAHIYIHWSVVGYPSWFNSLVIVYSDVMNMAVHVSFLYIDLHSFRYMLRSHTGQKVGLIFVFWKTSVLISIMVVLIYICINSVWRLPPPGIFIGICCLFSGQVVFENLLCKILFFLFMFLSILLLLEFY